MKLNIRDCDPPDIERIVSYFLDADEEFLVGLGVDLAKLPERSEWQDSLLSQAQEPLEERQRYYVIWEVDGTAIGHSNLADIRFGVDAQMHLHMWDPTVRRRGSGARLVRASIDRYFELFQLETLLCEPRAENPAPNRTLPKIGFELVETYHGTPRPIAYPQPVNRWRLSRERWKALREEG